MSKFDFKVKKIFTINITHFLQYTKQKTKQFLSICNNLKVADKKTLFVLGDVNKNISLSSRNLEKCKVVNASSINTYEVLNAKALVLSESSVDVLNKLFKVS